MNRGPGHGANLGAWARTLVLSLALATLPGVGFARPPDHAPGFALDRLDAAVDRHEIDLGAAARQKLYYLFDRSRMDPAWQADQDPPLRCGTSLLIEIGASLDQLDAATRSLYEHFTGDAADARASAPGVHLTTHFRIEYDASGPDAPPPEDVSPANGVPDFVERTGEACEHSWAVEVDALGYRAPELGGPQGRYQVQYQEQSSYGFTIVVSGQRTRIVLHPNYQGFPTNDDPGGDALGALRATVAHELKHAIQRMYTDWLEGSVLELDATWVEDVVYDDVNDHYNFIEGTGSPLTQPGAPMGGVGAASYEDCNWQIYQAERFGNEVMRTFWERRALVAEAVMNTYAVNLVSYGTTLGEAWAEYVTWNFASGRRASAGFGYEEGPRYPTTPAAFHFTSLPVPTTAASVPGLAANTALVENPDGALSGTPEFTFTGNDNPVLVWGVSVLLCDRAGTVTRLPMALTQGAGALLLTSRDWADLAWAALVIGNSVEVPTPFPYSFSIRAVAPILISHDRVANRAEDPSSIPIRARVSAGTSFVDPASVSLTFRIDGGAPSTVPMTSTGVPDEYAAAMPPQPVGTTVEYRITASSTGGDPAQTPAVPGSWFATEITSVAEHFETAGEWTVGDVGDGALQGIWERAQPIGTIAAPYLDATLPPGAQCYLTGRGSPGAPAGEADVDGGKTTLLSPVFGFYSGGGYVRAEARYRRWYSNQVGGRFDDTWRVDVSNDGGASWVNLETVTEGENDWVPLTVDLLALFGQPSQVRFRFVAEDVGSPSLVEAGVDDFEIVAVLADPVAVEPRSFSGAHVGYVSPNPSRAEVRLPLVLRKPGRVAATVRDPLGRVVRKLFPGRDLWPAGSATLQWDGRGPDGDLARAGIYWIEIVIEGQSFARRVAIVR